MGFSLILVLFSIIKCSWAGMEPFIVGGEFVKSIEEFPHVAFLLLTDTDQDELTCGSSIINQYVLLTAAHCVQDVTKIVASVGNVNRMRGTPYPVEMFAKHPRFDERTVTHDVSLCKLRHPLVFGKNVKRAIIMKHPPHTSKGEVAGWGAVEEKDYTDSDLLKHTEQKLWTYEKCKSKLGKVVPAGTICGGKERAKTKFCSRGDSGSGLVVDNVVIVGLVSFKYVKLSRSLVVYTDASFYYSWIKGMSRKLSDCE